MGFWTCVLHLMYYGLVARPLLWGAQIVLSSSDDFDRFFLFLALGDDKDEVRQVIRQRTMVREVWGNGG